MSKRFLIATIFFALFGTAASAAPTEFEQVDCSANLSQLIRSNAPHYWNYMKREADLRGVKSFLDFTGVVAGDPHLGNFSAHPISSKRGGPRRMRFVDVDFDDAGRAPFVLDFVRYEVAVKAFSDDIKKRELERAYLDGLNGKEMKAPAVVQKLLDMSVAEYDAMAAAYTAKHTVGNAFKYEPGKIEPLRGRVDRAKIEALFPRAKVLDVAGRPKDRGGSADGKRLWILVENDGGRRIMELKQRAKPGVAWYQRQLEAEAWLKEVRDVFWAGLDGAEYDLVELEGELFWLRPKGVALIDVPYSSEKASALAYTRALALYDANLLGRVHGAQAQGRLYREAVARDTEVFHAATKELSRAYLNFAAKALDRK